MPDTNIVETWNFTDHERLIHERCNRFCYLNHCSHEEDELLIEAHVAYVRATQTWKPGQLEFASFLCMCVDRALIQFWESWDRQPKVVDDVDQPTDRRHFDLTGFLGEVSKDAREAIVMALKTGEVKKNRHVRKKLLRKALKDIGWTAGRIASCWKEIREALS